jgi:RNA polymerase sigma-70 factor (ECF subfamily)
MLAPTEAAMPISEEDQLLTRCRQGDIDALGQLYARYEQAVFRHAYYLLGNRDDAQDVRQETFLRAYRALPAFNRRCTLKTWLLTICTNLCRDHQRSMRAQREVGYDPGQAQELFRAASPAHDPAMQAERAEVARLIQIALLALPAPARELIVLRDVENLEFDEIAMIARCTRLSVPVRLFRARRLLRERVTALLKEGE